MHANMLFWCNETEALVERIQSLAAKEDDPQQRREIVGMLRALLSARENAQRCAVDAAPYVHPKLQSVATQHSEETVEVTMTILPPRAGEDEG
jgi:hypothetical protein